jgi:hypothetical protein
MGQLDFHGREAKGSSRQSGKPGWRSYLRFRNPHHKMTSSRSPEIGTQDTDRESTLWRGRKPGYDSVRPPWWDVNNVGNQLAIMANRSRGVTFTVESLKNKGVRLNVADMGDTDTERVNENIVIRRGNCAEIINRRYQRLESGGGAH